MQPTDSTVSQIWQDLRRRKVVRVAAAYGVGAWVLVEASSVVLPALLLPDWTVRVVVVLALAGFPITLVLTWLFDVTERGLVRTETGDHSHKAARWSLRVIYGVAVAITASVVVYLVTVATSADGSFPDQSIAVLPFLDLSEDRDNEYFGDGIAEELLNSLVRVDGLRVAARTSSFSFKGKDADIREIGDELNVATVLEGSIRRQGDRIRITAQLIDVEDGFHLWSETYDRTMNDIFVVQDEIASAIVGALKLQLVGDGGSGTVVASTSNIRAYDLYLEGRHHWHQRTGESLNKALELFEQAVALDPDFALAYTGVADTYLILQSYGHMTSEEALPKAEPAIARALALDNQLPEAYASLGLLRLTLEQSTAAELALRNAIQLNPNYSMAHMWLGLLLRSSEGLSAAHDEFERAYEIDPLHPVINRNLSGTLANMGRYQEAQAHLKRVLEQDPNSPSAYLALADVAKIYGRFDQSISFAYQALELEPDNADAMSYLARAFASLGDFDQAEQWTERLAERLSGDEKQWLFLVRADISYLKGDFEALRTLMEQVEVPSDGSAGKKTEKFAKLAQLWRGVSDVLTGAYAEGAERLEAVLAGHSEMMIDPNDVLIVRTMLSHAYLELGDTERANAVLDEALILADRARADGWGDPRLTGAVAAVLVCQGRLDEAAAELRAAVDQGWNDYWFAIRTPFMDRVRQLPEFQQVMEELKQEIDQMRSRVAAAEAGRGSRV